MSNLLRDEDLQPSQKESLGMIVSSGELLLRVVNDVLDYSKLESGKVEVDIQKCNLQEVLDCVVRSVETNAHSKNISVATHYGLTVDKYFMSDNRRLQQILYNLLGNAIKFSKEDGKVELVVDHHTLFTTGNTPAVGILRLTVKDYGKGIEKENFKKIFEPFIQASAETERLYGGTGLGLSISAKIIKALGGQISVESEVGKGTAMHVDFPWPDSMVRADIMKLSPNLRNAVLFLVGSDQEEAWEVARVFKPCVSTIVSLSSMEELEDYAGSFDDCHDYVCLVNENKFDKQVFQDFSENKVGKKMTFVTLGPKFCVKDAHCHFRQLSRVLPCILIQDLDNLLLKSKETNHQVFQPNAVCAASLAFEKFRVLIAEDNIVNQKVLVRVLNRIGVEHIEVVENGKLAVDKEAEEHFDVVFMDMQMPIMDGIEACQHIVDRQKRESVADGAKIIFCTAHVLDSFKNECYTSGGSGFLSKPFHMEDVKKCLQDVGCR